jgi:alkaline phosphatase
LGVDSNGDDVDLITEILLQKGFITGLVATSEITHATPAGFSINNISRYNTDEIAKSMYESKNHILMGGGKDFFMPESKGGQREDEINLVDLIKNRDTYLDSKEALVSFDGKGSKRIFGLFAKEGLIRSEDEPSLLDMFKFTLDQSKMMAEKNGCSGFFIMAEGSQIDWAGHENDFDYQYEEMDEFHDVVGHALEYVKSRDDTLLIVLSDHETGGLLIEMDELRRKPSNSMLLSWNTALEEGTHTGTMIPAFSYGPGAINFTGVIDNTDVFFSLKEAIGINELADKECKLND